jgi:hypothetical protein
MCAHRRQDFEDDEGFERFDAATEQRFVAGVVATCQRFLALVRSIR